MSTFNFSLPGPGTAAFIACVVAIYSAAMLREYPALCWIALSATFFIISSALIIEYSRKGDHIHDDRIKSIKILLIIITFIAIVLATRAIIIILEELRAAL